MEADWDLTGRTLLGKLRVLRQLGSGGYGAVYEVEHTLTHNRHALKVLHPGGAASGNSAERLIREAGIAGRVRSARLVTTLDVGQLEDGRTFVLMELLEGRTWRELVKAQGHLHASDAVRLAIQVCEGLAAAHAAGVVHRDLKPDNVFLIGQRGSEEVKILDFGLARNLPGHTDVFGALTSAGGLLGTPHYVSPEQGRGRPDVDGRADQYALGVMLYESLAGKRPFAEATISALIVKIIQGDYYPLDRVAPYLPFDLVRVVHRAMHADRDQRFASAEAMADALGALEDTHGNPNAPTIDRQRFELTPPTAPMVSPASVSPASDPYSLAATTPVSRPSPPVEVALDATTPRVAAPPRAEPTPVVAAHPHVPPIVAAPLVEPRPMVGAPARDEPTPRIISTSSAPDAREAVTTSGLTQLGFLIGVVVGLAVLIGSVGGVYLWQRGVPRVGRSNATDVVPLRTEPTVTDPNASLFSRPQNQQERELASELFQYFVDAHFESCLRGSEQEHPTTAIRELRVLCAAQLGCWSTFIEACEWLGPSNGIYRRNCASVMHTHRGRAPGQFCPPPYYDQ